MIEEIKQWYADRKVAKNDPYKVVCPHCHQQEYRVDQYIGQRRPNVLTLVCQNCHRDFDVFPHDTHGYKVPSCSKR